MLGFPTKRQGKPAIKFKAYLFDDAGRHTATEELVILQTEGQMSHGEDAFAQQAAPTKFDKMK